MKKYAKKSDNRLEEARTRFFNLFSPVGPAPPGSQLRMYSGFTYKTDSRLLFLILVLIPGSLCLWSRPGAFFWEKERIKKSHVTYTVDF